MLPSGVYFVTVLVEDVDEDGVAFGTVGEYSRSIAIDDWLSMRSKTDLGAVIDECRDTVLKDLFPPKDDYGQ